MLLYGFPHSYNIYLGYCFHILHTDAPTHLPHLWFPLIHCSNMVIALAFVTPIRRLNIGSCQEETDLSAPTCCLLFSPWMSEGVWPHCLFPLSHFLKISSMFSPMEFLQKLLFCHGYSFQLFFSLLFLFYICFVTLYIECFISLPSIFALQKQAAVS